VDVNAAVMWAAFLGVGSLVLLADLLLGGGKSRVDARLDRLSGSGGPPGDQEGVAQVARSALPRLGAPLVPKDEEERTKLQARLIQAGLYSRQALVVFLGVKMVLIVAPALLGLAAGVVGLVSVAGGLIGGAIVGVAGLLGPSFWLDRRKANRQTAFRRSLPDALDVLVICLEGGLSLAGAVRRVAGELRGAHPCWRRS